MLEDEGQLRTLQGRLVPRGYRIAMKTDPRRAKWVPFSNFLIAGSCHFQYRPEEGMDETLTVHKLRVPDQLRRTLCCTNVIESAFSIVETVCRNVKRWQAGDQIERWVGSGLLVAERQFRKVIGHRQIPLLLSSMANAVSKKPIAKGAAVA